MRPLRGIPVQGLALYTRFHVLLLLNTWVLRLADSSTPQRNNAGRAWGRVVPDRPPRSPTAWRSRSRALAREPASAHRDTRRRFRRRSNHPHQAPPRCVAMLLRTGRHCLAAGTAKNRPSRSLLSTCGTLPVSGVSITGLTCSRWSTRHRLITPAPRDLPLLAMLVTETVTSLATCRPAPDSSAVGVCTRAKARVISAGRTQKLRLTPRQVTF